MRRQIGVLCLCGLALGCGVESATERAPLASDSAGGVQADSAGTAASEGAVPRTSWNQARFGEDAPQEASTDADSRPRIIYTADVELVAQDFNAMSESLTKLIAESKGYIASSSQDRHQGRYRTGRWVARVPVGQFDSFLASLDDLGFVESRDIKSEDVTMEYVDVASRIANLKRLEERFIELLESKTGKLEDILKVEQELARVRGDIEQAEGRMRYLTNRTDYSTVTINVHEERNYVPPQTPTLASRIADVWSNSLGALSSTGIAIVLFLVGATPWLIAMGLFLSLVYALARMMWRRRPIVQHTNLTK